MLAEIYPWLQTSVDISLLDVERLKKSLEIGTSPIDQYRSLAYSEFDNSIDDKNYCDLLKSIADKPGGISVAIEIMSRKLSEKKAHFSDILIDFGQWLISECDFTSSENNVVQLDYQVSIIINTCFNDKRAEIISKKISGKLLETSMNYKIYIENYSKTFHALIKKQPYAVLDSISEIENHNTTSKQIFPERLNLLSTLSEKIITSWCEKDPKTRYPIIASVILPFKMNSSKNRLEWNSIARKIINNSSNPCLVLEKFSSVLHPTSWSGSLANIMEQRLVLLTVLKDHEDKTIAEWARKAERDYMQKIHSERKWELEMEKERNERFE